MSGEKPTKHRRGRRQDEAARTEEAARTDEGARPDEAARLDEDAQASTEGADRATPEALEAQLAEKQRECQDLLDRLQRLAADFSNYQKRSQRRLADEKREAVRALLRDLLPVIDNFERAIASAEEKHDAETLLAGVRIVHDQLLEVLARHGVEPIEAAGLRFDPERHEAVAHLPSEEHPRGHVIEEVQRGYRHKDQTLRPSRVAVSRGPADAEGDEEEEADSEPDDDPTSRDREGAE